jgi:uncharacterized membrane protein YccF (DUF307 family)
VAGAYAVATWHSRAVKTLLNLIWLVCAGLLLSLLYLLAGLLLLLPIVTIPFARASFRLAGYALWPFGRRVVEHPKSGVVHGVGNLLWLLFAGIWLALAHLISALLLAITIIGLPLAAADLKMIPLALAPLGKQVVRA